MSEHPILEAAASCPGFRALARGLPGAGQRYTLGGVTGSAASATVAALHQRFADRWWVVVTDSPASADDTRSDLDTLLGPDIARVFPQREALPYEGADPHVEVGALQVEAVEALLGGRCRLLVTTWRALQERTPIPSDLDDLQLRVSVGDDPGFSALVEQLLDRGFERTPLVEEVGQFAVRGGLIDAFSFGGADPVRIEFWGDEVVSIRSFDVLDQRSTAELSHVTLLPVALARSERGERAVPRSILELLPESSILVFVGERDPATEAARSWDHVVRVHVELVREGRSVPDPAELILSPDDFATRVARAPHLTLLAEGGDATLRSTAPPLIDRDMKRLKRLVADGEATGVATLLLCDNGGQAERLEEILGSGLLTANTRIAIGSLGHGFVLHDATPPLRVFTDHEIFRRARRLRRGRRFRGSIALESLAQLSPGDFVVHMDHGVGIFRGLDRVTVGNEPFEVLVIEYAGGETLRVPIYRLDLLERWVSGSDGARPPQIHRIGGKRWKGLKRKTQAAIQEMAAELLELYAKRESAQGHRFPPDTEWQREMEASFLYDDTPDQRQAIADVKVDMESARPMDRLICGDVGYGKTEIAIRAAFKTVQDGLQVVVLAPTTVLVEQHRHTFDERLADFPIRIAALSRFRSAAEAKEILARLAAGDIDIVIGTHRLLSADVKLKSLGLLIVDEEQRFGVKHKERLKALRGAVDVLTLSATPIPRTLHQAVSGLRDLSIIRTPPRDRMPIITHVLPWSDHILSDALLRELDRGGQVFFLHNRVETIETAKARAQALAPEATLAVAHGQMKPLALDRVMTDFVDGKIDILVCSAIIENGLDVPNANTLIVDDANHFGLSQLYQIRGRVGRSDRRAYCYLVVPDRITDEAEKRLRVLEHYTELGSGYAVAMKDLELRGAGNLLGADQSGFAHAVGLDTYLRLLRETMDRLKKGDAVEEAPEAEVSLPGGSFLPDEYVSDAAQKLHLYRRISRMRVLDDVSELQAELGDRYGPPPPEVTRLLDQITLRLLGARLGLERILVKDRVARLNFRAGAEPRLGSLGEPLMDRQVQVNVRRMSPLSLELRQEGGEPLVRTLIEVLGELVAGREQAALEESAQESRKVSAASS